MKKIMAILMTGLLILGLSACGSQKSSGSESTISTDKAVQTDSQEKTTTDNTAEQTTGQDTENVDVTTNAVLVVYFSNTGNTKSIAEHIANGTGATLYEIVPETSYTDADLDYNDNNSRSTLEMNDPSARPVITGTVENFEQYSTVYIGYPIWWGEAPRILDTFVEAYDFTGKTVIPFCTSGGSGVGSSASNLESVAGTGTWQSGQRFRGGESEADVMAWVNGQ